MAEVITLSSRFRADLATKVWVGTQTRELLNAPDPQAAHSSAARDPSSCNSRTSLGWQTPSICWRWRRPSLKVRALVFSDCAFKDELPDLPALRRDLSRCALSHGHGTASRIFHALDEELQTLYVAPAPAHLADA